MTDVNNNFEALDRALKKVGITLVDDHNYLRSGRAAQCIGLVRKLLLFTSTTVAKTMLLRGCPSQSPDQRIVVSAFDILREKSRFSPKITVDQFLKEGYAAHKLAVLTKLTEYIQLTEKGATNVKITPAKTTYVVPPDSISVTHESPISAEMGTSNLVSPNTNSNSGSESRNPSVPAVATSGEWAMTDFIKLNLMDRDKRKRLSGEGLGNSSPLAAASPSMSSTMSPIDGVGSPAGNRNSARRHSTNSKSGSEGGSQQKQSVSAKKGKQSASSSSKPALVPSPSPKSIRKPTRSSNSTSPTAHSSHNRSGDNNNGTRRGGVPFADKVAADDAKFAKMMANDDTNRDSSITIANLSGDSVQGEVGVSETMLTNLTTNNDESQYDHADGGSSGFNGFRDISETELSKIIAQHVESAISEQIRHACGKQEALQQQINKLQLQLQQQSDTIETLSANNNNNNNSRNELLPPPAYTAQVEAMLESRVQEVLVDVSKKYDLVINKLVSAVDAEFTLISNKIKLIELELEGQHRSAAAVSVSASASKAISAAAPNSVL